jgi:anti-sigma28 factor (negative regulator of flagellin synthesis)
MRQYRIRGGEAAVKTVQERHEEQRQAKLAQIRQQIKDGTLVVRQMTDEERAKLPERPAKRARS